MKTLIIFIAVLMAGKIYVSAQEQKKDLNVVIVIDTKVITGAMANFRVIALLENGGKKVVEVEYSPGNLSLPKSEYEKMLNDEIKTTLLAFDYYEYCKKEQTVYNYEIDIKKGWLQHSYYVLYIYNTNKRQFKGVFDPLEGKNYTFEFDYPGGSTKRIRKRKLKTDCK
ncbi:MAG: hypothetical protein ACKO96_36705 [Flammeovirgaceae bacterium]